MSLQNYDPRALKRKRQLTGNSDNGEGSGGQNPGDLETGIPVLQPHAVSPQGQELDAARKLLCCFDILSSLSQMKHRRIGGQLRLPRPS